MFTLLAFLTKISSIITLNAIVNNWKQTRFIGCLVIIIVNACPFKKTFYIGY